MEAEQFLEKVQAYLPADKLDLVKRAYDFAAIAHQGQQRESGEPYLEHSLETANILAELGLDATSLAAALLHDVPEDCEVPLAEIEAKFSSEVAKLVAGVTKLASIFPSGDEKKKARAENLRKMLVAMAEDLRVVFIKLADRLHNMRTLGSLPCTRQRIIAQETLDIYAPLAHRLGIWEIKNQLEDLSFSYLQFARYHQIEHWANRQIAERKELVDKAIETIQDEMAKAGLKAEVSGRTKGIYSIYQKMEKYISQNREFDDIHDILAIRIIVDQIEDCYHALGIIHSLWHPLAGEFNDYIANPKDNSYQSIHTTVMGFGRVPLEIQIRTWEMHYQAEYGVSAHWCYKEGITQNVHFDQRITWLRQLLEWHKEIGATAEFLESVKTDIFQDQVFVYTPKGNVKDLPAGSTPIDFAYHIHTDLGHRCIGAKVNGKLVPLAYQLRNGDTIEIVAAKGEKGPSRDWLNPNLGYVKTSHALSKIRQWFKKQAREENIEKGREILEKELKRLGLSTINREDIARLFKLDENMDDFYANIGCGDISPNQIAAKLTASEETPKIKTTPSSTVTPLSIQVLGTGSLLTHLAQCCRPLPGDEIIGYITRSRGIVVHCQSCPNIIHTTEKERLIEVEWGGVRQLYPVDIHIDAWDRVGLLRDISSVVAEEKVNIARISSDEHDDHTTSFRLALEISSMAQLSRLLSKLEGVKGIFNVVRG
jgi:GTP pyrophosphokinase